MLVEVDVFVRWKCIEDMRFCIEVIDLHVDIECRDCILSVVLLFIYFYLVSCVERVLSCCNIFMRWNDV